MQEHINGYALALLDLAKEEKKLKEYKEQAIVIVEVLEANTAYIHILGSNNIEHTKRIELAKKTFGNKNIEKNLLNYVLLLIDKNKTKILISSLKRLISYINEVKNIHEGFVYSVSKLSPKEISDIEIKTAKTLGFKVNLVNKLDAHLISGIRVFVNDEIIDNSVETQLETLKQKLLEGEVD